MEDNQTDKPTRTASRNGRPTIGLVVESFQDLRHLAVWPGVSDLAQERDANLFCFIAGSHRGGAANVLHDLVSKDVIDGLICFHWWDNRQQFESVYERWRPLPVVNILRAYEGHSGVMVDGYQAVRDVMRHLVEVHGYRRIAHARGPEGYPATDVRYRAYVDALEEYGLALDPKLVYVQSAVEGALAEFGAEAVRVWLDERGLRPHTDLEAVVAFNDGMAREVLSELQRRGVRVPSEMAVVGFDDDAEAKITVPPLTTMALPYREIGQRAAGAALAKIAGEQVPEQIVVPTSLVARQSCGCTPPAVTQVAVGPVTIVNESLGTALVARRAEILAEAVQALGPAQGPVSEWVGRLLDGFAAELQGQAPGIFVPELDDILRQVYLADGDIAAWHQAISTLRRRVLPYLDSGALLRAEDLWQQARVMIGDTAQRAEMRQVLRAERQARTLREISQALITTFDTGELMSVLADRLPRLDIPSCYLSLYEDPHKPTEWSRLILAYNERGRVELEPEGRRFPSRRLIPEGIVSRERRYSFVVEALYFQEHQLGFVLFEAGPQDGKIYETLRDQISSALQGALLTQERERAKAALEKAYAEVEKQVEERTAELQQEIIERRQAQEALVYQQYLMRSLMDNTPDNIYFKDTHSRFIRMNKAQAARFDLSDPAEAIGKTDSDFFTEEHARQAYADERQVMETGQPIIGVEEKETWPDGHETWASTTKLPLRDEEGRVVGTFGISRDITKRKRAEAELTAAREMEQKFSEQLAALVAMTNELSKAQTLDELCRRAVEAGRNRLGFDRLGLWFVTEDHTTMLGTYGTSIDGQTTDDRHARHPIVQTARLQPIVEGSIALQRYEDAPLYQTDGKQIGVGERIAAGLWDGETVIGFLSVDNFISRRPFTDHDCELLRLYTSALGHLCTLKRAQEDLTQLAKALEQRVIERTAQLQAALKEMEAFSYSVSHDLRAPLRAIDGFSHILMDEYAPQLPPEATRYLETICDSARQMGHLVDGLLAFSRLGRQPLHKQPIDTADLVRQALQSLSGEQVGRRIEISTGELPACQGDPALLRQVWINLLSNALKFTRQQELTRIEIGCLTQEEGGPVYFVKDNGVGFDMRYAGKLFGVFQRLHRAEEYEGTGVGLAIVQRIIHRHGGRVWAEGAMGQGATFYFTLSPQKE
jgi:PAS domain S-box-containing protein